MTLEEIDKSLAEWKAKLTNASDNLHALTELITYQRLRGEGGWPKVKLTGITQDRVGEALEAMCDLWQHVNLFRDVVKRASAVRATLSRFMPSRKTLQEIEALLTGPSIKLPPVSTPLAKRGLLTAKEITESVTPQRLLEAMTKSFEVAKEAVLSVDQVWERYPNLLMEHEEEILALRQLSDKLEEGPLAELTEVQRKLVSLRGSIETDPLAVKSEGDSIAALLKATRARLAEVDRSRAQLKSDLASARRMWDHLQATHQQAKDALRDREQKVRPENATSLPKPLADDQVEALGPWLAKLEATHREGQWRPVLVGFGKWSAIVREYITAAEAAREGNLAPLRERDELRGLLDALKAKAKDRGLAGDAELNAIAEEAWQLLHSRPTPLERARQLVTAYQSRLI
jgi:hypothetical protein